VTDLKRLAKLAFWRGRVHVGGRLTIADVHWTSNNFARGLICPTGKADAVQPTGTTGRHSWYFDAELANSACGGVA
jgi:hypothetical protein